MKKRHLLIGVLLCFSALLWAKEGAIMYVNVEEAELKSGTGFFASSVGFPLESRISIADTFFIIIESIKHLCSVYENSIDR